MYPQTCSSSRPEAAISAVDVALDLGAIARSLYLALRSQSCFCFDSSEYIEYLEAFYDALSNKYPDPFESHYSDRARKTLNERFWAKYTSENPFKGERVEELCSRCAAMDQYETFIGPDDVMLYVHGRVVEE
ncbi:MAG: hypothetical protein EB110_05180 [Betaproteobacteria bacterium]|nr:hypothetical protein [Betaproteobacteria bacterium]